MRLNILDILLKKNVPFGFEPEPPLAEETAVCVMTLFAISFQIHKTSIHFYEQPRMRINC